MSKGTKKRIKGKQISVFPIINLNAAGIDVSDKEMMVCVPGDRCDEPIQAFGTFTCDLRRIAQHLKQCKIDTVAMESTGVYWVQLFLILHDAGFDVYLVNAQHVKNVTGRKDDEEDAAWIQRLHSCGLLNRSFQPDNETRKLRTFVRHRKNLIESQSQHVNRMIKALELMNIKLHTVISDILGKSGQAILHAILKEGVRDAQTLSQLTDPRIKASPDEIIKSLEGDWREEYVFELSQNYDLYLYYQKKLYELDVMVEKSLQDMTKRIPEDIEGERVQSAPKNRKLKKNEYSFNVDLYLEKIYGVDVTAIFGVSETCALEILAESGTDMTRFKNSKHFCAWLGIAPNTKISGGKIISSKILKKQHRAGQAFKIAANSLWRSENELGNHYRRIKSKAGPAKAVVATARKIATIYYTMIQKKEAFNPHALKTFQETYKEKKIRQLKKQLAKLEAA